MARALSDESKCYLAEQLPEKTLRNVFESVMGNKVYEFTDGELEQMAYAVIHSFSEKKEE